MYSTRRYPKWQGGITSPKENKYYRPYSGDLERFKVYLNSREYFNLSFPNLVRYRWRNSKACDITNNDGIVDDKTFENTLMFQTMAATWVATWECGISQEDMKKPDIVGAIYRFHVYFTVRRILRSQGRLTFYILDKSVRKNVWKYLPTMYMLWDVNSRECIRICKLVEITDKDFVYMVAPTTKGITRLGVSLLQESVMTYVYDLLAAQAVNPGKNIVGNNGVALMLQKSFLEKIEDRIRADNGVDNILELYERTLQHSTATGTFTVHERITKIPSNLKIKEQKQSQREEVKIKEKKEVVDIKPLQSAVPIVIGVGVGTLVIGKIFSQFSYFLKYENASFLL